MPSGPFLPEISGLINQLTDLALREADAIVAWDINSLENVISSQKDVIARLSLVLKAPGLQRAIEEAEGDADQLAAAIRNIRNLKSINHRIKRLVEVSSRLAEYELGLLVQTVPGLCGRNPGPLAFDRRV